MKLIEFPGIESDFYTDQHFGRLTNGKKSRSRSQVKYFPNKKNAHAVSSYFILYISSAYVIYLSPFSSWSVRRFPKKYSPIPLQQFHSQQIFQLWKCTRPHFRGILFPQTEWERLSSKEHSSALDHRRV